MNKFLLVIPVLFSLSCGEENIEREPRYYLDNSTSTDKIENLISAELDRSKLQPTAIINNEGQEIFQVLGHTIRWAEKDKGVSISINGFELKTAEMTTLNNVWSEQRDSVKFANYVDQIYIYEEESIVGLVLRYIPCSGLGCGVNYQIIVDLKTGQSSCFGRFRTGFDFGLYDFKRDGQIDYLSKTFYGRNESHIDTTEYEIYTRLDDGTFGLLKDENGLKYSINHIRPLFDSIPESLTQHWTEKLY